MFKKLLAGALVVACAIIVSSIALPAKEKKNDLYKQIELFSDSLAVIQTDYVDDVKPRDLIYGALRGMLSALDPHSQFMDPDTYNELKVDTEGKFGGLGIEITIKDGLLTVVTPIEDSPAWKAGLKSNDRIVKINNDLTRDITLTDAVKKLRGRAGDAVTLTILRESEKKLLEIKLVRDVIKIQDIKNVKILEDGIGYIRLVEFRENTAIDLASAIDKLKKVGLTSLIIDLRNNPGGLLDTAVQVAEHFVEKGKLIVSTKGRKSAQNMEFVSQDGKPITDLPLAILINEGSASGSEIVAAALQDYRRAIIVGTKSFGKGSVQTIIPLSDGSALRLTTSKYYTPLGHMIHGKGVIPDILVEDGVLKTVTDITDKDKADDVFDKLDQKTKNDNLPNAADKQQADYKNDNQLARAIDILKAVKIFRGQK
jgi:carboxyl-terminal processing protease